MFASSPPHPPRCAGHSHWCMLCGQPAVRSRVRGRAWSWDVSPPYVHVGGRVDRVVGHLNIDPYVAFSYYALYLQLTLLISIECRRCPLTKSSRCVASLLCQWPSTFIIVAPNSVLLLPLSSVARPTSGLLSHSLADPTPCTRSSVVELAVEDTTLPPRP